MGLFGIKIPEKYGGLDLSFECYAGVCMELARGWMSLAGIINTHVLVGYAINEYGTEEQKPEVPAAPRRAGDPLRSQHHRARCRLRRPEHQDAGEDATATIMSSMARRCGSPTASAQVSTSS